MGIPRFDAASPPKPLPHALLFTALRSSSAPRLITALQTVLGALDAVEYAAELVSEGGTYATVASLTHPSANTQSRELSVKVLLSLSDDHSPALRAAGVTRAISRVLCGHETESDTTPQLACATLFALVRKAPGAALEALSYGAVPSLCRLLVGGSCKVIVTPIPLLGALARFGPPFRAAIVQADGVRSIALIGRAAAGNCPHVAHDALSALSVFAGHDDTRGHVKSAGGLHIAVKTLVGEMSVPAATHAACLIAKICSSSHGRRKAIVEGAVLAAVDRLGQAEASQELAVALCVCLIRLFHEPAAADEAVAASGTVETLFRVYLCAALPQVMLVARRAIILLARGSPARRAKVLFALKCILRLVDGEHAALLEALRQNIVAIEITRESNHGSPRSVVPVGA